MHKRTYLNACLVLALAAGASQASAAPGASEMAGDVAVLQASPASTGHARFANPNAATSAAGIHFAAPPPAAWPGRRNRVRAASRRGPEDGDSGNRPGNPRMDRHPGRRHTARFPISAAGPPACAPRFAWKPAAARCPTTCCCTSPAPARNLRGQRQGPLAQPSLLEPGHRGRYPDRRTGAAGQPATGRPAPVGTPGIVFRRLLQGRLPRRLRRQRQLRGGCGLRDPERHAGLRQRHRRGGEDVFTSSADGGSYICTGTLLNNGNSPKRQLFWSAAHCIEDQATAATLQTIWFYNTTQCYGDASTINQSVTVLTGGRISCTATRSATPCCWNSSVLRRPACSTRAGAPRRSPTARSAMTSTIRAATPRSTRRATSRQWASPTTGIPPLTRVDWPSAVVEGGSSGSPADRRRRRLLPAARWPVRRPLVLRRAHLTAQ